MKITASMRILCVLLAFSAVHAVEPKTKSEQPTGALLQGHASQENGAKENSGSDKTIMKVVKLLQGMLDTSKKEGEDERVVYAKYKCYCDTNEEEKKANIQQMTETIAVLETEIEKIQGASGGLSQEVAELKADMAANEQEQSAAAAIRAKEAEAFTALEEDMNAAIGQMGQAIDILAAIGGDQTLSEGADHKKFMAGYKDQALLKLRDDVKAALLAATSFISAKELPQENGLQQKLQSLLQEKVPSENYAAQSGVIVGVLKSLKETFEENLKNAKDTEAAQIEAHDKFMKTKKDEYDALDESYSAKQSQLGDNDDELSAKKDQLTAAEDSKASDEAFLDSLLPQCAEKAKDYEKRKMLRATEQAAIAEAIAILNSDQAFETFGKVDATSTGATGLLQHKHHNAASFLQMGSRHRHVSGGLLHAQQLLEKAATEHKSARLAKVAKLLKDGNPFTVVLEEIDKILELLKEEAKADKENLDWCNSERESNDKELENKKTEITELETAISELDDTINAPETGLKDQIASTEESLVENAKAQETATKTRKEENLLYQEDVANIAESTHILKKAIKVLKKYYDNLAAAAESLVQKKKKEEPAPPETWEGEYKGQSESGNEVITMLEFVLSETEKEEEAAHKTESDAQADYEKTMTSLKTEESNLQESLTTLKETLAEKEAELLEKQTDLKRTKAAKKAIEEYLLQIKPGCDFITENFDERESHRMMEEDGLKEAKKLIKDTPAYKAASAEAPAAAA